MPFMLHCLPTSPFSSVITLQCVCVVAYLVQAQCGLAGLLSLRFSKIQSLWGSYKNSTGLRGYIKYGWPTYTAVDCIWFAFEVKKPLIVKKYKSWCSPDKATFEEFDSRIRCPSSNRIIFGIKVRLFTASTKHFFFSLAAICVSFYSQPSGHLLFKLKVTYLHNSITYVCLC